MICYSYHIIFLQHEEVHPLKHKKIITILLTAGFVLLFAGGLSLPAHAAAQFDPAFYAATYPDVTAALGTDPQMLLSHYLTYGMAEDRVPFQGAAPGTPVDGVNASAVITPAPSTGVPVPIGQLANRSSLKKKQTDAEFAQAYNVAWQTVAPLAGLPMEDQLWGIAVAMRDRYDSGMMYSMSTPHYNDPYGYFVLGTASCAGCARATGLCLNILGIPYEHVNENQYSHQWCRVNVNGTYWICDAYGLYCGPEPAPYMHPYL